jgi:sporulation protein YlmC with PRC-barrel domain
MKWLKMIPMLMIVVLTLAACGLGNDGSSKDTQDQAEPVNGAGENTETNQEDKETEKEVVKEEAAYVGLVDANSIQVNTESRELTLEIAEVAGVEWSSIAKNSQVIIEYYQNENDQYMLTSIKVVDEKKAEETKKPVNKAKVIREEGAYVGQVDANSIQVNTESESITLQISEAVKVDWSSLAKNQHVIIEYVKNSKGQHVLQHLEVVGGGKKEESNAETTREEAAFVGQVDTNSIQVNTEFQQLTLQIGEVKNVDWSSFAKNKHVIVEYYQNKDGQYILTNIE